MALNLAKTPLIKPVIALAGWSYLMELWMYSGRIPALTKYNLDLSPEKISDEMKTKIPPIVRYKADNYNHLHEQPTYFIAVALSLALIGDNHKYTNYAAWGYVGLRVVHSLYQSILNDPILVRFSIFASSSVVLAGLTARAAQLIF